MTLVVPVSAELEAKLRERAAAAGKDAPTYASELLEQAVRQRSLDELLAPLREQFAATGTTDEELIEQISQARQGYRNQH